jgi:hypothetical protein
MNRRNEVKRTITGIIAGALLLAGGLTAAPWAAAAPYAPEARVAAVSAAAGVTCSKPGTPWRVYNVTWFEAAFYRARGWICI